MGHRGIHLVDRIGSKTERRWEMEILKFIALTAVAAVTIGLLLHPGAEAVSDNKLTKAVAYGVLAIANVIVYVWLLVSIFAETFGG
jgi:hypothetical protein